MPQDQAAPPGAAAGEIVQFAQLRRAFEGLGFEPAFRSALACAKARRRRQPLGQRAAEKARRVSPGQQVGGDQQRDGHDDGQAEPEEETHQRFLRRDEDDLRQLELRRVAAVAGCSARPST